MRYHTGNLWHHFQRREEDVDTWIHFTWRCIENQAYSPLKNSDGVVPPSFVMKIPRKHEKLTIKYWQLNQTRQLSNHYLNKDGGSQAVVRPIAISWWRHQMETFSALLVLCAGNSPVSSEFPAQRPVTRSFDVFFDLHLNKRLSKQSWGWWFETPSRSLWRHRNVSGRGPT